MISNRVTQFAQNGNAQIFLVTESNQLRGFIFPVD